MYLSLVLPMLLSTDLGAAEKGERLPVGEFTAVRLARAPVIDGKMAPGEWDQALATSGLIAPFDHALQESETTMYLGFDEASFYFCFRCRRGNNEWKLWKRSRSNDEYDFGEPSVEIWVTPPTLVPETYQNIINTYPAVYDQKFIPSRGYAGLGWKANWKVAESEDESSYTIEASVPIKDFGFDRVKDGDTWRFLLGRNCLGAKPRSQASWSITQGFSEIPQHLQVHFADTAPAVQLLGVISVLTGRYRFPMAVMAPAGAAAEVELSLRFHKNKSTGDDDIVQTRTVKLAAGQRRELAFDGATPQGWKSGNFTLTARTRDRPALFRQSFPFTVSGFELKTPVKPDKAPPVEELALAAMYGPQTNTLIVKADSLEFARRSEVAGGTITLIDPAKNKVLSKTPIGAFREYYSSTRISLEKEPIPVKDFARIAHLQRQIASIEKENKKLIKEGKPPRPIPTIPDVQPRTLQVQCELTDQAGKTLVQNTTGIDLLRYNFEWSNNTIGMTDKVIPPWTPVQFEAGQAAVWNRAMELDGLGLARQIRNGDTKQLAAAMRLVAVVDGQERVIEASAPRITRQVEASVDLAGTGRGAGLALSANSRIEFDGFTLVDLTIAPAGASARVDRLTLEISLPEEEATHYCTTAGGWAAVHDVTPDYWSSLQTASGTLVNDFVPYLWLTNSERGLLWFADSDQGWITESDRSHPSQELVKKDGRVTLKLHFIEVPTNLTGPTTVRFGYQAFPSRPLPAGWRAVLCNQRPPVPDTKNTYFWFDGDWAVLWPYYSSPFPWNMDKSRDLLGQFPVDTSHRPCVGSIAHSIGRYRDYEGNTFPALAVDWAATPGHIGNSDVTNSRGPNDFRLYHYQRWVREARFRGLYIDENYLSSEGNWLTGNAYYRADGRLQQGYSYLGQREYFKRMMVMFHQNHVPRPNLWMHITSGAAYHSWFGDIYYEGENVEPTDLKFDYLEVLPASRLRAIASAACSGGVMTMMTQAGRHPTQWVDKHLHQYTGWVMAHDVLPEQVPYWPILMQEGRLYEEDVKFHPYWKKQTPVRTPTPGCIVSAHQTAGRAMLWTVNTDRRDKTVEVEVDFARLGLDPQRTIAVDAETSGRIPLTARGFAVPVLQRDFVAVHLIARKHLSGGETFIATFDQDLRADEAIGCNAFVLPDRTPAGTTLARCAGIKGMALEVGTGVSFWPRLHVTNDRGRIRFHGLVADKAAGRILELGPLSLTTTAGKNPAMVLSYKAEKSARPQTAEVPALAPGWHAFDLSWEDGQATLVIDGNRAASIAIEALGIAEGRGTAMTRGSLITLGDPRGALRAVDELRCSDRPRN